MAKRVEYKGKKYRITFYDYGYTHAQLFVNGEGSDIKMYNTDLDNVEAFRRYALRAVEEYIDRQNARKAFNKWNGKL